MTEEQNRKAVQIVDDEWTKANEVQNTRNEFYNRINLRYKGVNNNISDPFKSNLMTPKFYSMVNTLIPVLGKAMVGRRPYVPIKSEKSGPMAELIELAFDWYLYKDRFKHKFVQMLKGIALFGTGFLEPYPDYEDVETVETTQTPLGVQAVRATVRRFRLRSRLWMPWQVYVDPSMLSVDDPGYIITVEKIHKQQIKHFMDIGRYREIDLDKLSQLSNTEKNYASTMFSAMGIKEPTADDNYGILMRRRGDNRYITTWNGVDVLEDIDNPFSHKRKNIARFVFSDDPMSQNSFWGEAEGKQIEGILDKLDESWNSLFDNAALVNQAVIAYDPQAIDEQDTVFIGGSRIPIKRNFQGGLKDAIQRLDGMPLPPDFYQIPAVLDAMCNESFGQFEFDRGDTTEGDTTATEVSIATEKGSLRNELRAQMLEALGMSDFADMATSHIDEFTSFDDWYEVLGDRALEVATLNPSMIPDADYQFRGSDALINDFRERADWREVSQVLQKDPTVRPGMIARTTLRKYGYSDKEIDEILFTDEEMQAMQAQAAMAAEQQQIQGLEEDFVRSQIGVGKQRSAQIPTAGNPAG